MGVHPDDIAQVRDRTRIEEVIGRYTGLRPDGPDRLAGLCVFHQEKTPSLKVWPAQGRFACFGACKQHGDVFDFLQQKEGLSFTDAVRALADQAGVRLRETGPAAGGPARARLLAVNEAAAAYFAAVLTAAGAPQAAHYLGERGLGLSEVARFGLGYAPSPADRLALGRHLVAAGFTPAEVLAARLVVHGARGPRDLFRHRLMFPIRSPAGELVGFAGRDLTGRDPAKYLNTPDTALFKKRRALYGVDTARQAIAARGQAVVVEGYTDVIACQLAGIDTAVAACGTAFTAEQAAVLRRIGRGDLRLLFAFDGDAAGRQGAHALHTLGTEVLADAYAVFPPPGMDPCGLRAARGDAALRSLLASARPLVEHTIDAVLAAHDLTTAAGRARAVARAAPLVARVADPLLRHEVTRLLAGSAGVDLDQVRAQVTRAQQPATSAEQGAPARDGIWQLEREALRLAVRHPGTVTGWFDTLDPDVFADPAHRRARDAIIAAGGVTAGATGSGSRWVEQICAAVPTAAAVITELAAEPPLTGGQPLPEFAAAVGQQMGRLADRCGLDRLRATLREQPTRRPTPQAPGVAPSATTALHRVPARPATAVLRR